MSDEKTYSESEYNELKTKLGEFRDSNINFKKDMEKLQTDLKKFDNIDVGKYNEMVKLQQDKDDKKLIDAGKIDELVEERVKRIQEDHAKEYGKLQDQNTSLNSQLEGLMIDSAVRNQAIKSGVVQTAIDDVMLRAKSTFKMKDGEVIPMDAQGNVIYQTGTTEPVTVDGWVKNLTESAPHLFSPSNGGGSQHGSHGQGGSKTVSRNDFDGMGQKARSDFLKDGGKVVE